MEKPKYILLSLVTLAFVFGVFFSGKPLVGGDYPYIYSDLLKLDFNIPQTWTFKVGNLGEYSVATLWAYPLDLFYSLSSIVGLSFSLIERIFGLFLILALGLWSMNRFLTSFNIKGWARVVGTIFYLTNTYFVLLIDGGQLRIALSLAWFPLAFILFKESVYSTFRSKVTAALAVSILGFFDIRFIYILGMLLSFDFIFNTIFAGKEIGVTLLNWIKTCLVVGIILTGLNLYWLLPSILSKAPQLPLTYARESQTSFLSFASLAHGLFMQQPHWYRNFFGKVFPVSPEFILIPFLVFLAPVLKKRSKDVSFWLLVALAGVFLVKGVNGPFPQVYSWLFSHIPGFSLFRDSTKFYFLITLSFALLLSVTIQEFARRTKRGFIVGVLTVCYLVFLARPVWLGKMTGVLGNTPFEKEYARLSLRLGADSEYGRVVWIPRRASLGYSSPNHIHLDASRLLEMRPFASGVVGSYELFNFLRQPYIGELLKLTGVKYLAYPFPDARREELKPDNIEYYNWFINKLTQASWIEKNEKYGPFVLFQTKENKNKIFLVNKVWWVIGSDDIYQKILTVPELNLSDNALVFAEEVPNLLSRIRDFPEAGILLNEKSKLDIIGSNFSGDRYVDVSGNLGFSPNKTGWWKREASDLITWRGFLQEKYVLDNQDLDLGQGWSVAEGDKQLSVDISNKHIENSRVFARVMKSSKGGSIEFYQGERLIGSTETKKAGKRVVYSQVTPETLDFEKSGFEWVDIGNLVGKEKELVLKTAGEINVLNSLVIIPKEELEEITTRVDEILATRQIINREDIESNRYLLNNLSKDGDANIEYEYLSPTHYKVRVSGLTQPAVLIFSEGYDPFWVLSGKEPLRVYSILNMFRIEKDGEYDLSFHPQKYILPGLFVSLLFLVFSALVIFKKQRPPFKL